MGINSILGFALAVGLVSGVIAYVGVQRSERKRLRQQRLDRERRLQGW